MKLVKYLLYLLLAVSVVVIFMFFSNTESDGMVSLLLNWTYVLFAISILAIAVLPFFYGDGKGAKGTIIKVGLFALVVLISYLCSSSAEVPTSMQVTEGQLKFTDGMMLCTTILMGIAILVIACGKLISKINNR